MKAIGQVGTTLPKASDGRSSFLTTEEHDRFIAWMEHLDMRDIFTNPGRPNGFCPYGRCGGAGFLRYDVPVSDPRFGRVVPCQCATDKQSGVLSPEQLAEMQQTVAPGYRDRRIVDFLGDDADALRAALNAKHDRYGIYVWWSLHNGNGKTLLLTSLVNEFLKEGIGAEYYTAQSLVNHLYAAIARHDLDAVVSHLMHLPVLAIDEFSRWSESEFGLRQFEELINYRYDRADAQGQLLTLIADNELPDKGAANPIESRLSDASRVVVVELRGGDMRPHLTPKFEASQPGATSSTPGKSPDWRVSTSAGNANDPKMQMTGFAKSNPLSAPAPQKNNARPKASAQTPTPAAGAHWSDDSDLCTLVLSTARRELRLEFPEIWQSLGVESLQQYAGTHVEALTALRQFAAAKGGAG